MLKILSVSIGILAASTYGSMADVHPPKSVEPLGEGPHLEAYGEIETIFDWSEDNCNLGHHADLPVRAYRDDNNQVNLIVSNIESRRMIGPDFDNLKMNCDPILTSVDNTAPEAFAHKEWLGSVYTEDGKTVHGLVHNEYQGNRGGSKACPSGQYFQCWYNTITYVRSEDGGAQFERPVATPGHLVAALPQKYVPDAGIFGVFSPSNIIKHESHYYAFLKAQVWPDQKQYTCLMRTDDLSDPSAWRFWTIFGFDGEFADPYRGTEAQLRKSRCYAVDPDDIAQLHEGISWNSKINKFVLIGISNDPQREPNPHGFYYAFSDDLINWEKRHPLLEVRLPWRVSDSNIPVYVYPTLIDHDSPSRNFETTGENMYLYFTRLNTGQSGLDRDLVRMRVRVVE